MMNIDKALLELLDDPHSAQHMRDTYVGVDLQACAQRFAASGEFAEVLRHLGSHARGTILDLGAGSGIASYAFARTSAVQVYALEPGDSALVGRRAIAQVTEGLPVAILGGIGEQIPLPDNAVDLVYTRQVLHHTTDLPRVLRECRRVMKPGGIFLACREHVVDDQAQLQAFLADHPIHQRVGGENAFALAVYLSAIQDAGLLCRAVWGPWDSVINAFPGVATQVALAQYPAQLLGSRFGRFGERLGTLPPVRWLMWRWLKRPVAGRLYSFLAVKP
jgi:SAM-dependent methyltransferase